MKILGQRMMPMELSQFRFSRLQRFRIRESEDPQVMIIHGKQPHQIGAGRNRFLTGRSGGYRGMFQWDGGDRTMSGIISCGRSSDLFGGFVWRINKNISDNRGAKGLQFSYIDTSDQKLVRKEIRKNTKALYIETQAIPPCR